MADIIASPGENNKLGLVHTIGKEHWILHIIAQSMTCAESAYFCTTEPVNFFRADGIEVEATIPAESKDSNGCDLMYLGTVSLESNITHLRLQIA